MRIQSECLACLLRQATDAIILSGAEDKKQEELLKKELEILSHYTDYPSPPHIAGPMHKYVREHSGCPDPYYNIKEKDMTAAQELLPMVEEIVDSKEDKLFWAVKAAAAGNTLDSGANPGATVDEKMLDIPFGICDIELLREKLEKAETVLYLGDNSGETFFDALLIKNLGKKRVYYAVRSCPAINDATREIAQRSGISQVAQIIESGSGAPGTLLSEATPEFRRIFDSADLVISKGQGNYEALDDAGRQVFYIFKVKCGAVSKHLGVPMGNFVLKWE